MRYAVIGAGAMGYRYGLQLKEHAGCEVDFIDTWEPNVETVREQGGVWEQRDHKGRHLVPIDIYYPEEYTGDPDVWVVFMKQMQLEDMLERCAGAGLFREHQTCFTAMNGLGHYEKLSRYFPADRLYGGTAVIATVLNGPGDVDFMGDLGTEYMHLCAYDNGHHEVGDRLFADLQAAKLGPRWSDDIMSMSMAKLMLNSVDNTLCTMFEVNMGVLGDFPAMRHMTEELVGEAYEVCRRAGIRMPVSEAEEVEAIFQSCVQLRLHYPSMCQDMFKGRPTEIDYINGYLVDLGRKYGYECVRHEFLVNLVHLSEAAHAFHEDKAKA